MIKFGNIQIQKYLLLKISVQKIISLHGKFIKELICVCVSCSVVSNSLQPCGLEPSRLVCPCDFPGKNTGVGCHFLLQRIFLTQGSNSGLLHCRQILYHLSCQGIPYWDGLYEKIWQNTDDSNFLKNYYLFDCVGS